jgi:hypothetical protein
VPALIGEEGKQRAPLKQQLVAIGVFASFFGLELKNTFLQVAVLFATKRASFVQAVQHGLSACQVIFQKQ